MPDVAEKELKQQQRQTPESEYERERREERERKEADRLHKEWANLSVPEKTQIASDKLFKGPKRFQVSIPKDKAQAVVVIAANSPEEAQARYNFLCGIRSTEQEHDIVPVG